MLKEVRQFSDQIKLLQNSTSPLQSSKKEKFTKSFISVIGFLPFFKLKQYDLLEFKQIPKCILMPGHHTFHFKVYTSPLT